MGRIAEEMRQANLEQKGEAKEIFFLFSPEEKNHDPAEGQE